MSLSQAEAFARIRLLRSPNIGPVSFRQLIARFGSGQAAIEALPALGSRGKRRYAPAPRAAIEREIEAVRKAGAAYLFLGEANYPTALAQLESAPPVLIYRGDLALAHRRCVAMVGARNASAASIRLARDLARDLAAMGFVVVSGLARGIDAAAHEGALPSTIGVIASGIDIVFPPQNRALQERIAQEALVLAEQPPGAEPRASHFPSRNRIIAALCAGTVVVEAALRSGSLITARLAGEAGREVMAIPGSPLDPRARGCNHLIREGAVLVESAEDIAELLENFSGAPRSCFRESDAGFAVELPPGEAPAQQWDAQQLEHEAIDEGAIDDARAAIEALLSPVPVEIDELVRQSGHGAAQVQMALLELELCGALERHAGGKVSAREEGTKEA